MLDRNEEYFRALASSRMVKWRIRTIGSLGLLCGLQLPLAVVLAAIAARLDFVPTFLPPACRRCFVFCRRTLSCCVNCPSWSPRTTGHVMHTSCAVRSATDQGKWFLQRTFSAT